MPITMKREQGFDVLMQDTEHANINPKKMGRAITSNHKRKPVQVKFMFKCKLQNIHLKQYLDR